jgi:peptidoglycan hydrolase-like protein with peptidoglycan-binding domain
MDRCRGSWLGKCSGLHSLDARLAIEHPAWPTIRLLTRGDSQVAQMHLRAFGFDPGPIDGLYTAETQAAVLGYQTRYGLPATGLLDDTTRLQLLPGRDSEHVTR